VRGVINLRGQVMPVIDLSERLGKGVAADSARQVIIVVEHHDDVAGLLVDAVCDSFIVSADAISPPPPLGEEASPLVSAVITTGRPWSCCWPSTPSCPSARSPWRLRIAPIRLSSRTSAQREDPGPTRERRASGGPGSASGSPALSGMTPEVV
jgi:hypothetical protein